MRRGDEELDLWRGREKGGVMWTLPVGGPYESAPFTNGPS